MSHSQYDYIKIVHGRRSTFYSCKVKGCRYQVSARKGYPGKGRAYGRREDTKAWSKLVHHISESHPHLGLKQGSQQ